MPSCRTFLRQPGTLKGCNLNGLPMLHLCFFFLAFVILVEGWGTSASSSDAAALLSRSLPQSSTSDRPARTFRHRPESSFNSQSREDWVGGGGVSGLWPYPQQVSSGSVEVPLSPVGFMVKTASSSSVLSNAISRYTTQGLMFPFVVSQPVVYTFTLQIVVQNDFDEQITLQTDESYKITVTTPNQNTTSFQGVIEANTPFGAMHGLETFSQLIRYNDTSEAYSIPDLPIIIQDYPRFPWR